MSTYTSKYPNGAAVDAALDKAGSALQEAHIDTNGSTSALHHTLGTSANQAASGADQRLLDAAFLTAFYFGVL